MLRASDIGNLIQVIILLLTLIIIQEVTAPADKRRDKPGGVTVSRNKEHLDVKAAGLSIKNSPYNPDHERYKSRPDSRSRNKVDALRTPGNDGGSRSRSSSFIERRTVIEGTVRALPIPGDETRKALYYFPIKQKDGIDTTAYMVHGKDRKLFRYYKVGRDDGIHRYFIHELAAIWAGLLFSKTKEGKRLVKACKKSEREEKRNGKESVRNRGEMRESKRGRSERERNSKKDERKKAVKESITTAVLDKSSDKWNTRCWRQILREARKYYGALMGNPDKPDTREFRFRKSEGGSWISVPDRNTVPQNGSTAGDMSPAIRSPAPSVKSSKSKSSVPGFGGPPPPPAPPMPQTVFVDEPEMEDDMESVISSPTPSIRSGRDRSAAFGSSAPPPPPPMPQAASSRPTNNGTRPTEADLQGVKLAAPRERKPEVKPDAVYLYSLALQQVIENGKSKLKPVKERPSEVPPPTKSQHELLNDSINNMDKTKLRKVSQPAERGVLNPEMPVTKEEKIVQSFTNAFEFWSAKQDKLKENGLADSDDVDDEEEDDGAFE